MEEIKEKLEEQENKINLLKELIERGYKRSDNLSFQSEKFSNGLATSDAAEGNETNKNEATGDKTHPTLSQPIPDLF